MRANFRHVSSGPDLSAPSVLEIIDSKVFSISAEIIPPRNGTDFEEVFQQISQLHEAGFDFISVTHGAGGSLRGGTLPIAHYAQTKENLTAIAHLTCRGVSKEDLENMLIDHHYFGLRNILALRGDPPDGLEAEFRPVPGGYSYAWQLIEQITAMNRGEYLVRKNFDPPDKFRKGIPTQFCIGAACYPEDPPDIRIAYLEKKKTAGAHFAISQMIFDLAVFEQFYSEVVDCWGHTFPVIPGIRIPKNLKQLERMQTKFGIKIPEALLRSMRRAENNGPAAMSQVGENWAVEFITGCRSMGVRGIHFFIMGDPLSAIRVKQQLKLPEYG